MSALRYQDLLLNETAQAPYGAILWPEDIDKEGKAWVAPISPNQQPDEATMLSVVLGGAELREKKA